MTAAAGSPALSTGAAPGSYRELLIIALPLMLSAGTQSLMHIVDRVFLTGLSATALAASLPAGILFWSCLSLPIGTVSYINAFVAQYEGAGQRERVAASVAQGAWFSIIAGLLLLGIAPFSHEIFRWIGHEPHIAVPEGEYFYWLCLGAIPALLASTLSTFFSGRGQTTICLYVNIVSVAANALLDYAMIFGNWGFPRWGIAGAAIATNLANCLACLIYVGLILRPAVNRQYQITSNWHWDNTLLARLLKFGMPSGLQMFVDVAGFTVFMLIIGLIGEAELAATNVAFNLNTLAFIPVMGLGIAVSTLVGQRIGEGRPQLAESTTWKAFMIGGGYMLVFGAVYILLPDLLLLPYAISAGAAETILPAMSNGDAVAALRPLAENMTPAELTQAKSESFTQIRNTVVVLLRFVTLYSFFDAMVIIFGSAIRAAGDTRFSMVATGCSAWILMVVPTWLTWKYYGPDLVLSWSFCAFYVIVLGFIFLARFLQGKWKTMKIIEHTAAEPGYRPEDQAAGSERGESRDGLAWEAVRSEG